jgi:hypothetical protein
MAAKDGKPSYEEARDELAAMSSLKSLNHLKMAAPL